MKYTCNICGETHDNPYSDETGHKEYYEGLFHQKETGDILIYHKHLGWIKPEEGEEYPGDGYELKTGARFIEPIPKGSYRWDSGDGWYGWYKLDEDDKIYSPNTRYLIKKQPNSICKDNKRHKIVLISKKTGKVVANEVDLCNWVNFAGDLPDDATGEDLYKNYDVRVFAYYPIDNEEKS